MGAEEGGSEDRKTTSLLFGANHRVGLAREFLLKQAGWIRPAEVMGSGKFIPQLFEPNQGEFRLLPQHGNRFAIGNERLFFAIAAISALGNIFPKCKRKRSRFGPFASMNLLNASLASRMVGRPFWFASAPSMPCARNRFCRPVRWDPVIRATMDLR
jgi:hypothetical protein